MSLSSRAQQLPSALAQNYDPQKQLASSPGKVTWLAVDRETGDSVVIKVLFFDEHFDWQHHKLFEREAKVLQNLSHPSLPKFIKSIDFQDEQDNGFALIQSYIGGISLADALKQGRSFSEDELKELARKVLEILAFLHGRNPPVIHRDIKPSNILLGDRSANSIGQVYLVDFDAVQTVITPGSTRTVVGSYGYMPPEQFGSRVVPASDLYALGATLIAVATGQQPADLPQKRLKIQFEPFIQLSTGLIHWLNQAIDPSLEERFSSATEALKALDQTQHGHLARLNRDDRLAKPPEKTSVDYIQYQKSEHRLSITLFSSLYDILRFTIITVCILMITIGILALQVNYGFSIFIAVGLWFSVIYVAALACSPSIYINPKILSKLIWPILGIYRIHIDPHHLTIEITLLGYSQYFEYKLENIANLSFIEDSKIFNQSPLEQRYPKALKANQTVAIEVNPFFNLEADEIQMLKQELKDWIKAPVVPLSSPDKGR